MPKIAVEEAPQRNGVRIPPPYDAPLRGRSRVRLGDAAGLSQFGVNLIRIPPGKWSSVRHWHSHEDEFVYVLEGEGVLVTDEGEQPMRAGDCAGFPAGDPNGHHIQNRSEADLVLLEVGSRRLAEDSVTYVDIDVLLPKRGGVFTHKDGTPYESTG
jgi:uncharacterized cupin superfamily protein